VRRPNATTRSTLQRWLKKTNHKLKPFVKTIGPPTPIRIDRSNLDATTINISVHKNKIRINPGGKVLAITPTRTATPASTARYKATVRRNAARDRRPTNLVST
jgi:hypothetical protein